jgi:hypothetical protein
LCTTFFSHFHFFSRANTGIGKLNNQHFFDALPMMNNFVLEKFLLFICRFSGIVIAHTSFCFQRKFTAGHFTRQLKNYKIKCREYKDFIKIAFS